MIERQATAYRFAGFTLSRSRRQLLKDGQPLPLIPRYFDLLVLLIDRRDQAVSRREIFDRVWSDVIVSDGALSQAVRTLRRTLGDDPREPIFIRTVSRHGYSFVFPDVTEIEVEVSTVAERQASEPITDRDRTDPDALITRLLSDDAAVTLEIQRDAAEQLHLLGTANALDRLTRHPGHARALAVMRDARWDVPGAGAVPLFGQPEGFSAAWILMRMRATQALRIVERRWANAAMGAAIAGAIAGTIGGAALVLARTSQAAATVVPVLAGLGAFAGAFGASGLAAGIVAAEAIVRERRTLAIVVGGAVGGLITGTVAQVAVLWTLGALFGLEPPGIGGAVEGLALGLAVGVGYGVTTFRIGGGLATPTGRARLTTVLTVTITCAVAGLVLSTAGHQLVGGLINSIAQSSRGAEIALTPLGRFVGHPTFGPVTKSFLAILESGCFGCGLAWGLTRRPARISSSAHESVTDR